MNDEINFLIVGLGLLGGSYAEGLSKKGHKVFGVDINQESINYAISKGWIIEGVTEVTQEFLKDKNVIIFCLYPWYCFNYLFYCRYCLNHIPYRAKSLQSYYFFFTYAIPLFVFFAKCAQIANKPPFSPFTITYFSFCKLPNCLNRRK